MIQYGPPTQTAKRKKTTDMPDSPPKRVTRARAKASEDEKPIARVTKVTTASAKAAASAKTAMGSKVAAEKPVKTAKRKTRADDDIDQSSDKAIDYINATQELVKTRGGRNKIVPEEIIEEPKPNVPKRSKSRLGSAAIPTEEVESKQPKLRGRPKKVTAVQVADTVEASSHQEKSAPAKVATRSRTGTVTGKGVATTLPIPATPKKRVTFQSQAQQDQENIPYHNVAVKKTDGEIKGLRAKPIRKPAAVKGSTRIKRTSVQKKGSDEEQATEEKLKPLSPKKVKQMAVAGSVSSEDELLSFGKTPMRDLSRSPVKFPKSPINDSQLGTTLGAGVTIAPPSSPTKTAPASVMATPAKRPPPSPFKDGLKDTPKRVNLKDLKQSALKPLPSPSKSSLHESPKRFNLGHAIAPPEFGLLQQLSKAPLLESPKRAKFVESLVPSGLVAPRSNMKGSLLQSPARRPVSSPSKQFALGPPPKLKMDIPVVDGASVSKQINSFKLPALTSQGFASSTLRVAKSPEHMVKVHEMTANEQHAQPDVSRTPTGSAKTPKTDGIPDGTLQASISEHANAIDLPPPGTIQAFQSPPTSPIEHQGSIEELTTIGLSSIPVSPAKDTAIYRSTTPPSPPPLFIVPAYSLASAAFQHTPEDSDSEDELTTIQHSYAPTPLAQYRISSRNFVTPNNPSAGKISKASARRDLHTLNGGDVSSRNTGTSITPLAMQLSTWRASSPEKTVPHQAEEQPEEVFANLPLVDSSRRQTYLFEASPVKPHFFEDEMLIRDQEVENGATTEAEEALQDYQRMQLSHESQASEVYGDENAVPIDPQLLALTQVAPSSELVAHGITCTPAKVFYEQTREICTVSKVPLRPAAADFPLKISRRRSKSMTAPLGLIEPLRRTSPRIGQTTFETLENNDKEDEQHDGLDAEDSTPQASKYFDGLQSPAGNRLTTPGSTILSRPSIESNVLSGAVVYVDVHTTEGADASGIFVELLTQMGARCVKQWLWNPRTSDRTSLERASPMPEITPSGGKIGITHVVYKDGGKRTLEKVRESKGVVLCVGVGWVLE